MLGYHIKVNPQEVVILAGSLHCQGVNLDSREQHIALFERYGALLTGHQYSILDLHLRKDWSLGEIAERQNTSRAAVHDLVRRSLASLELYEERLGLVADDLRRRRAAEGMQRRLHELKRRIELLEHEVSRV